MVTLIGPTGIELMNPVPNPVMNASKSGGMFNHSISLP
jgi:hypothetical protein